MDVRLPRLQRRWAIPDANDLLPAEILILADKRFGELAWRADHIPKVIEAASLMGMLNLGGDMQIRGISGYGEPIGAYIDTERVSEDLPWSEQVHETARVALEDLLQMRVQCDFTSLAREAFPGLVDELEQAGHKAEDAVFFRWLVTDQLRYD